MSQRLRTAHERRAEIQANAEKLGITRSLIDLLVETFYERVRLHDQLGPIFEHHIEGNWASHLSTMKDFWSSVTVNSGDYSGKPVPAHKKLVGVEPHHFDVWLGIFNQTLLDIAPNQECTDYFMIRADRIARSLRLAMFGIPSLGAPK